MRTASAMINNAGSVVKTGVSHRPPHRADQGQGNLDRSGGAGMVKSVFDNRPGSGEP